jgi:TnpA family transposase
MPKIEILSQEERINFDTPPKLTKSERDKLFNLPKEVFLWLNTFESSINKVGFILLLGYCKHTGRFFLPKTFHRADIDDIASRLNLQADSLNFKDYKEKTCWNHKQWILNYLQMMPFDHQAQSLFQQEIMARVARRQSSKQILIEVREFLRSKQIEVPGYNRFTFEITRAFAKFEKDLVLLVKENLQEDQVKLLDQLLKVDTETHSSELTQLKSISHSKRPQAIRKNVVQFRKIQSFYQANEALIKKISIHEQTIKHYGNWVKRASLQQINKLSEFKRYLYLLAFIAYQYYLHQDILADTLLACVKGFENAVAKTQKDLAFENSKVQKHTLQLLAESRISYKALVKKIQTITKSKELSDSEKVEKIHQLIESNATHPSEDDLDSLQQQALDQINTQEEYALLEDRSIKLQNQVSEIMKYLQFNQETLHKDLLAAILDYQAKSGVVGKNTPKAFLTKAEINALMDENGKFRVSLYKVFLFSHVADTLRSGALSLLPSYRYLTVDDYLYPLQAWKDNKQDVIDSAGLGQFQSFSEVMSRLENALDLQYHKTNQRIISGKNTYAKFDQKNRLILRTPKIEKINLPSVSTLLYDKKHTSILKILSDIHRATNYLSCFKHYSVRDQKVLPHNESFYAAIIGLGCNIGISKMANVSKGITEDVLENLVKWHFSLDNIFAANNKILELRQQLSLPTLYKKSSEELHTSSDGRKMGVAVDSLNANHSFKYFGSGIGSCVYSFIDERHFSFYSTMISSSEREAAYVIDGLLHNLSIKSTIHSTDTHGYSEAIFAVTNLLGVFFAPRIKNLKKSTLYGFKSKKVYEQKGYKILPERYIDKELIETHWDSILRLMATIKLKEASASQIFKRLSSYSKQNPLYCAIKEFGRVIKSLFILRYIDELELRQAVEKQLNIIELSNKFSKAIMFGNNQEIQHSSKEEQDLVVGCQRLIQNAITLWNELCLSQKLAATQDDTEKKRILKIIRNGSTMAWQHLNMHGEYDFTQNEDIYDFQFDMEKILAVKVN